MNRKKLVDSLSILIPSIDGKGFKPALQCFCFKDNVVTASNLETSARVVLEESTGLDFLIPAKSFFALLKSLDTEDVELSLKKDTLHVKSGKTKAKYATYNLEEMVDLNFDVENWSDLPDGFFDALSGSLFSICDGLHSRYGLASVYLKDESMMTTDGHRLTKVFLKNAEFPKNGLLLPQAFVSILLKHKSEIKQWSVEKDQIFFKIGESDIVSCSENHMAFPYDSCVEIAGNCSTFKQCLVFPESFRKVLQRQHDQMYNEDTHPLSISVEKGVLTIVTKNTVLGSEIKDEFELEESCEDVSFVIVADYLADVLANTDKLKYSDEEKKMVAFSWEDSSGNKYENVTMLREI